MKSIEVIISMDGEVTVEAVGYTGSACELATRAIEEALGVAGKRTLKREHSEVARHQNENKVTQ